MINPDNLCYDYTPVRVRLTDNTELFCAHHRLKDNGWLYLLGWEESRRTIPPHRVVNIRYVETEIKSMSDGRHWQVIADDDLRELAFELIGNSEESAEKVVADD